MRRLSLEWLAVLAASALVCAVLVLTAATSRIDNVFYDNLLRLGHRPASADIVIVTIDEQSLAEVGAWPWPRSVHARILDRLTAAGVRAIAYDVLFVEPGDPGQDGELVEAAANAGNLCLPVAFDVPGANGAAYDARPPFQPLATVAGLGHVDTPYDADGVARRAILAQGDGRRTLPHLMECARLSRPQAVDRTGQIPVSVDGQALVREAPVLIPFTQPGSYRTVPAVSVLRGEVPAAFLKDKYVLVGATAAGLNDRHATPVTRRGGAMPGIELEANLLDGRINGQIARQAGPLTTLVASEVGVLLLMLTLALATPRRALPLGFGLMLLAVAASALALIHGRIWMGPFPFIITALAAFPLWGWRRLEAASHYMLEELQRFSAEPDLLTLRAFHAEEGDTVARQIQLMNQTIQRVRDLRQFTSDTLKSLPDPTLVVGLQGAVLFANPAARELAGVGKATGVSLRRFTAGWTHAAGDPVTLPGADEIGDFWAREVAAPDGRPYLAAIVPYRTSSGALAAWIVRLTDISDLKAAAAQREQIIQLLTHDMRSPQSSIIALLETAPSGAIEGGLARKVEGYARRTLTLASNFVQLARAGAAALPFELLDLSDVLTEAVDDLWPQAKQAGIVLATEGTDEEHLVRGERALLTRALVNLLDNAIKYSPGGGTVTGRVAVSAEDSGQLVLTVADQGVGMSSDQAAALFTPFQRFTAPDRRVTDGAGLGLMLVWEVVRRHDGAVAVSSQTGEGTTFTLTLPRATED